MKKVKSNKLNLNKQTVYNLHNVKGGAQTVAPNGTCAISCRTCATIENGSVCTIH